MSKVELLSITVRLREGFLCQAASVLIADANGGHHDLIANTRNGQIYAAEMFGIMPGMKAQISAVIAGARAQWMIEGGGETSDRTEP